MIKYKLNRRPSQSKDNSVRSKAQIKRREREKSSVRSKVEHVFGVVKGLLRYRKTRYKGLRKQTAKLNIMFALANLILADRPHLAAWFSAPWRAWWVTHTNFTICHSFYGNGALFVRCCLKNGRKYDGYIEDDHANNTFSVDIILFVKPELDNE